MKLDEGKYKVRVSLRKNRQSDFHHHELDIEADSRRDAHTKAAKHFGYNASFRIHGSTDMEDHEDTKRLDTYNKFRANQHEMPIKRTAGSSLPAWKKFKFGREIEAEKQKKAAKPLKMSSAKKVGPVIKRKQKAAPPEDYKWTPPAGKTVRSLKPSGSAAHTFVDNIRKRAAQATNEGTMNEDANSKVLRLKKSVDITNQKRNALMKSLMASSRGRSDDDREAMERRDRRISAQRKELRDRNTLVRRQADRMSEGLISFGEYVSEINESKNVKAMLANHLHDAQEDDSGWHSHDKATDTHTVRRGFYYRHGMTSEKHAASVSDQLTKGGIKHKIVDHGEVYGKAFKGGASVKHQDHFWTKFKIEK